MLNFIHFHRLLVFFFTLFFSILLLTPSFIQFLFPILSHPFDTFHLILQNKFIDFYAALFSLSIFFQTHRLNFSALHFLSLFLFSLLYYAEAIFVCLQFLNYAVHQCRLLFAALFSLVKKIYHRQLDLLSFSFHSFDSALMK